MMEEHEIFEMLQTRSFIDMATDRSYDPETGILSYGWAITLNEEVIATGRGPAEGHPEMAEPIRAETYGLAAGAEFLNVLIQQGEIDTENHVWTIHIDNTNLIKQMETIHQNIRSPKWSFTPHADILKTAHKLLSKIPVTYSHVKAHQDRQDKKHKLSRAATLNIMADELAQRQRQEMRQATGSVSTDHTHLIINNITITKEWQQWLIETSSRNPAQQYYRDKYKWNRATFHKINWKAQHKVLQRFDCNHQRRILKFCHGWLPTNQRLHRENQAPNPQCALCHHLQETNIHLFTCKHPEQQEIRKSLYKRIENDNANYGLDDLVNAITDALRHLGTTWTFTNEDKGLQKCLQDQDEIGWENLLKGRTPKSMTTYIDTTLQ
jgi:hypothetical protein